MVKNSTRFKRKELRVTEDDADKYEHWAEKNDLSFNEFMQVAANFYIHWQLNDYDVPLATVQRINQLVASQTALSQSMKQMSGTIRDGFEGLYGLMNDGSYLAHDAPMDDTQNSEG